MKRNQKHFGYFLAAIERFNEALNNLMFSWCGSPVQYYVAKMFPVIVSSRVEEGSIPTYPGAMQCWQKMKQQIWFILAHPRSCWWCVGRYELPQACSLCLNKRHSKACWGINCQIKIYWETTIATILKLLRWWNLMRMIYWPGSEPRTISWKKNYYAAPQTHFSHFMEILST